MIPKDLQGKELFQFLRTNKKELKALKKGEKRLGDGFHTPIIQPKEATQKHLQKMEGQGSGSGIVVDVVANLAGWMDSDNDVLRKTAYNKTIADNGNNFLFLRDHQMLTTSIIAKTLEVYTKQLQYSELGINGIGTATALMFKGYLDEKISGETYWKYKEGIIKQHSIGFWYMGLNMAINDPDFEEEYKLWKDQIGNVINREKAEAEGWFWDVAEIKLVENSAVPLGASSKTPTMSIEEVEKSEAAASTSNSKDAVQKDTSHKSVLEFYKNL